MPPKKIACLAIASGVALCSAVSGSGAAEYAFTTYPLGSLAFGAGITPPPGIYVTDAVSFYTGTIGGNFDFGGRTFNAGVKANIFVEDTNILFVPKGKLLDGYFGASVSVPAAYVDYEAHASGSLASASAQTQGTGMGDTILQAQLGWTIGDFSHTLHVSGVIPTGRYATGFFPITGLNRPSLDVGWAFTWFDKATKLQFNGALGFMTSTENFEALYQTGNEFHFEWAIGYKFDNGLVIGVAGYDYRQVTGDSGQGAHLGPFEGAVDAIGPGLSYTTKFGETPVIINVRDYQEYDRQRRFQGNLSIASVTAAF